MHVCCFCQYRFIHRPQFLQFPCSLCSLGLGIVQRRLGSKCLLASRLQLMPQLLYLQHEPILLPLQIRYSFLALNGVSDVLQSLKDTHNLPFGHLRLAVRSNVLLRLVCCQCQCPDIIRRSLCLGRGSRRHQRRLQPIILRIHVRHALRHTLSSLLHFLHALHNLFEVPDSLLTFPQLALGLDASGLGFSQSLGICTVFLVGLRLLLRRHRLLSKSHRSLGIVDLLRASCLFYRAATQKTDVFKFSSDKIR
mmetsp:Transcript_265/g.506  ORF Transcript_265/g.506 Transcript_265/m.506 type:complete len:251 (-) Transcript_265:158-910(-)